MRHSVPVECTAELCGVTHKTALEWRHRVLATVSGYQDRIVPRDTVWVDETHIKGPVAVAWGHGKPSSVRVRKAMGGRIAPGSPHIRDLERAHNALVRDGGLEIETHRS